MIDIPVFSVQLLRNPAISVCWPCSSYFQDGIFQFALILKFWMIIKRTTRYFQNMANGLYWIFAGQFLSYLPFLVSICSKMSNAFFAISSSIVLRPSTCSSSAMRCCSSLYPFLRSNTLGAFCRNSVFQRDTICWLSLYLRQISARLFSPLISCRTTLALNSDVKVRLDTCHWLCLRFLEL